MPLRISKWAKAAPLWIVAVVVLLLPLTYSARCETLTFRVRELGVVRASLDRKRDFPGLNLSREYFQGRVRFTSHAFPLAASRSGKALTLTFPGKATGVEGRRQRLYTVKVTGERVKVTSIPRSYLPAASCAEAYESGIEEHRPTVREFSDVQARETVRVISLRAFTDPEWLSIHGESSSADVASAINVAEGIYNRQLGIRFKVLGITPLDSPFSNSSPSSLLNEFRVSPSAQGDSNLKALFTGKDMDGSTIGIAYVGAICYAPQFSFSVSQSYGALTGAIFAHEVGHNLGATHDFYNPDSLMYPSISYSQPSFSVQSLSQIESHLSYFGECLGKDSLTPLLSGSKLSVSKGKKSFTLTLRSPRGTLLDGVLVRYTVNGKRAAKITSPRGTITLPVTGKGMVTIEAYVASDPTITVRARVRVK